MGPVAVFQTSQPHPLAIVALVIVVVAVFGLMLARQWFFIRNLGAGESTPPESKTNCPTCGARVHITADVCSYCGEGIERGGGPR